MDAIYIMKKFLKYAEYDPEQKTFNLLSAQYRFHRCIEKIQKINAYDPTGAFGVMYAKKCFTDTLKDAKMDVFSIISDPSCLDEEREMWDIFSSADVKNVEESILASFSALLDKVSGVQLIGKRDIDAEKEALFDSIEAVVEALPECNEDLFLRGGDILPVTNFSTNIHVFSWLSQCLMALEQAEDGMYLCFIRNCDAPKEEDTEDSESKGLNATADGYFGFYIKSNGSLLSVNERVNEMFSGEHKGHRNARYSNDKKYNLFPYSSIFSFSDYDYKGVATTHTIDDEKLEFLKLEATAYMPLVVAMMLLNNRYAGSSVADMPLKYVDSLLPVNLEVPTPGTQALMVPATSSIAVNHKGFTLNMSSDDILNAVPAHRLSYNEDTKNRHYTEYGTFPEGENIFVKLYGEGFELDTAALLESNSHLKRLTSAELATTKETPNAEFVGTEIRFEIDAYKKGREQLAKYIRDKMFQEYVNFGGAAAVEKWYINALKENWDRILDLCVERYNRPKNGDWKNAKESGAFDILLEEDCKGNQPDLFRCSSRRIFPFNGYNAYYPSGRPNYNKGYNCCINTENKASIFFTFQIRDWGEIQSLLQTEDIPKILKGYVEEGHRGIGNSILKATDACTEIGTPFESHTARHDRRYWTKQKWSDHLFFNCYSLSEREKLIPADALSESPELIFDFAIGFSKRGWAKVMKERANKNNH